MVINRNYKNNKINFTVKIDNFYYWGNYELIPELDEPCFYYARCMEGYENKATEIIASADYPSDYNNEYEYIRHGWLDYTEVRKLACGIISDYKRNYDMSYWEDKIKEGIY